MIKLLHNLFWKIVVIVFLGLLLYVIYQWSLNDWTIEKILNYFYESMKYVLPGLLILFVLYKSFIEKIILRIQRKKSAKVIAEDLNQINQVSGAVRSGKDSSTTGAAIITKEYIMRKELKELKKLRYALYIYDFSKIDNWLDQYGKRFFVASEYRINQVFTRTLRENDCFIDEYWINKGIDHKKHLRTWKYRKGKEVPDVAYLDGLTPGGIHFLDMLRRYILLYMYYHYVPNFIMSNQPIMEDWTVVKKTGKINRVFSKRLSQDYFKLKEDTPIPFPMRGFVIETETAIFYSNVDTSNEKYVKDESGIREFYTTAGHLLREQVFVYGITQSATRVMKALRELYPGYQHVFKMKFRATSDFSRSIIHLRILFKKFKILRLRMLRFFNRGTLSKIRYRLQRSFPGILNRKNRIVLAEKRYTRKIQLLRRKISRLYQKDLQKWSKGFIVYYKGVYENLADVGKKVSFPLFGVLQESKKNTTTYQTFGFKQVNKIKDSFGRYDTHFMKTVREAKEILQDMHFVDVPNWPGFTVTFEHILEMNYSTFKAMMQVVFNQMEAEEKERKKQRNILRQRYKSVTLPNFTKLETDELLDLCTDFGIDKDSFDLTSKTYKADIIMALSNEYKSYQKIGKEMIT